MNLFGSDAIWCRLPHQRAREILRLHGEFRAGGEFQALHALYARRRAGLDESSLCGSGLRAARTANALYCLDLRERKAGAGCDAVQHRMLRIAGQAQSVCGFPRANANVGAVLVGALLGKYELPLLQALVCFLRKALSVSAE